jgi:hypothetical protein
MMVLALDQAPRHTGFCYGESSLELTPTWGVIDFPSYGENDVLLLRDVRKWLNGLVDRVQPKVIYCEQIVISTQHIHLPTTYEQFAVVAAITAVCADRDIDLFQVDIATWRKRGLGRGNRPKDVATGETKWLKEAALKACLDMGWLVDNHNAAEAALIWDYGCAHADIEYRRKTAARATRVRMAMEERDRASA